MPLEFNQWMFQSVLYETNYYVKDVVNEMFDHIVNLVNRYDILQFDYAVNTMKIKFYTFMYEEYYLHNLSEFKPYDDEMYEYFTLKFSEDILNVFSEYKEINKQYSLQLFNSQDSSISLQEFLFDTLLVADPYVDTDSESEHEMEQNINYSIDESSL